MKPVLNLLRYEGESVVGGQTGWDREVLYKLTGCYVVLNECVLGVMTLAKGLGYDVRLQERVRG